MTQQPVYAPQYPQAPQGYGQQPPPPQYAQPVPQQAPYQPVQQGYPQQQIPQGPPPQPLAQGTLDDYYNQPTAGGGPSIAWSSNGMQKPIGTTYVGIVARDVAHGDVQHDTDPKTGAGKFYRDGRPRWVMKVPLKQVMGGPAPQAIGPVPQEFPEGEASWFVRGQARDELTRAQTAAGLTGDLTPKEGDVVQITLVERRPSRGGGMPANIVQIVFQPGPRHQTPGAAAGAQETVAASPAPVSQASQPAAAPVSQGTLATPWGQAEVQYQVQQPQPVYTQPDAQGPPPQWAQPPAQQQPVQQQAPQGLQPPAGLDPEQQALLARIKAAQGQG